MINRCRIALLLFLWGVPLRAGAEEVRVAAQGDWQQWSLPEGALEATSRGIRPSFVRRDVDAIADAPDFGGGIRGAGTDLRGAAGAAP